jgi:glycosyltransferase involved in cell wall biosynthesis
MRVFAMLVGGEETPSARERVLKYLPALKAAGIDMRVHVAGNLRPGLRGRIQYAGRLLREPALADVVLLHRVLPTEKELRVLTAANPRLVFDFDDALWIPQPGVPGGRGAASESRRLQAVLRASRRVLAGNAVLGEYASRYAERVEITPTCVDLDRYVPARRPAGEGPVLGWIGLGVNLPSLEAIAGPLREACAARPGSCVRVICDHPPAMVGAPMQFIPWRFEEEVEALRGIDVGLMPLPDDAWSRGKCAWKALQYMALGIPPVVSPVGANREVVTDGETGLWASTAEEWRSALGKLMDGAGLRRRLGAAARRRVEERYSAPVALKSLIGALKGAAGT